MPWDLYTPFAKKVLTAGYDFAVDEDGGVSINEVKAVAHSFARALKGAVEHADILEQKVAEEIEKGFIAQREGLWGIPATGRRTDVVKKAEPAPGQPQKWRCVADRSDLASVSVFDGKEYLPAAPNSNTEKLKLPQLRWTSLQAVQEGGPSSSTRPEPRGPPQSGGRTT